MPTLQPADITGGEPHQFRQVAESFGGDAERYDRSRPQYPAAMIDAIVSASPGSDFLDVGCGTGIAARQFQAVGARVLGVDVDGRMAGWATSRGLEVEISAFETWDRKNRDFDAVVAGQAWHWVDPVVGAAKAVEALRPGGRIAVFWNAARLPEDLVEKLASVYRRVIPGSIAARQGASSAVRGYSRFCERAAAGMRVSGSFEEPERWRFHWERTYSGEQWLDQLPTHGDLSRLPADALEAVLSGVATAIEAQGGSVPVGYCTLVETAAKSA